VKLIDKIQILIGEQFVDIADGPVSTQILIKLIYFLMM